MLEGSGVMELDSAQARVQAGDAVLIPPGAWHEIRADDSGTLRFLCACAPPYRHEDTYFVTSRDRSPAADSFQT